MTLSLCPNRLATRTDRKVASREVIDCAAYAWRNAEDESRCYQQLPEDFVHDYRAQLDEAATRVAEDGTSLFGRVLTKVWAEHGYTVELAEETDGEPFHYDRPRQPADKVFHAVWDEAAYRLDVDQVVKTADLADVLTTYTGTPLPAHAAKKLRDRKKLHQAITRHLNEWADTADSPAAEQQIEGYRAALDNATTVSELRAIANELRVHP